MSDSTETHPAGNVWNNPLVPAAALLLLGVAIGRWYPAPRAALLAAIACVLAWMLAEVLRRRIIAHIALAAAILMAGIARWSLNQTAAEPTHIARFTGDEESPVTLHMNVLALPETAAQSHATRRWIGRTRQILTDRGWIPAAGDALVSWTGDEARPLAPGMQVEVYGWLSRPPAALNPGAFDPRRRLAADRIFAQIRVPRATGVTLLNDREASTEPLLTRFRLFLRGKLLEHTVRDDVPAAYTLTALLLGYRDPAVSDVSRAFADAGIAHLLAISGTHIVFFTGLVWGLLRFLPLRPRWREPLIAAVVGLYVLATPCGPPIVRAAAALAMVVVARLIGRSRAYLNILAAAAIVVVLMRPADILDAGFQLSFVATGGLILFSERVHRSLFHAWLERRNLIAELAGTKLARWRLRISRSACAIITANLIGALTSAPLVAYHFGQANLWAVATGLLALPVVSLAMIVSALQLLAELAATWAGAMVSPISVFTGRAMIWLVGQLAALPGAALAVRPPPGWAVMGTYGVLVLWALRRRLGLTRAVIVNACLAMVVATAAWYTITLPVGTMRLTALSAGQGSCILLGTPRGDVWVIDAGSSAGESLLPGAVDPALRLQGTRRLDGFIATALDAPHGRWAGQLVAAYRPPSVCVSEQAWPVRGQTLAGAGLDEAISTSRARVIPLTERQAIVLGQDARIEVLWPPAEGGADALGRRDLILLCSFGPRRVLIADPAAERPLAMILLARPDLRCDLIVFTGLQRGAADAPLRQRVAPLRAQTLIWCGRGPWAPRLTGKSQIGEFNTANGAVSVELDESGTRDIQ